LAIWLAGQKGFDGPGGNNKMLPLCACATGPNDAKPSIVRELAYAGLADAE
jgi:hypothetical protein